MTTTPVCFVMFDTAVGACAVAWTGAGIAGVQLPEGTVRATRDRMARRFPSATEAAPPDDIARAVRAVQALVDGEAIDLSTVALDMTDVPPFHRRVYDIARTIPPGETASYGDIATRLGAPGAARAVGQALGHNPFPVIVPCHRVLAARGALGGFSAYGGVSMKERLLGIEGALLPQTPRLF